MIRRFLACFTLLLGPPALASEPDAPAPDASPEAGPDLDWEMGVRVRPRLESRFGHHFGLPAAALAYDHQPDRADVFSQQSRLTVQASRKPLSAGLTLQHTASWGDYGGDALTVPPLFLYDGWLRYAPHPDLSLKVGRFELAYGDQRVLGSVGWSQVGRTWDGLRAAWRPAEDTTLDLFAARYQDGGAGPLEGDAWLTGLYGTAGLDPLFEEVDLYVLYDVRLPQTWTAIARRHLVMVGTRLDGTWGPVGTTAEGGVQAGQLYDVEAIPLTAWFFDAELHAQVGALQPYAALSMASGDDPETPRFTAYDQLYPTGHAFLGYMDLVGPRTNLREIRSGVRATLHEVGIDLAVHDFTRLQPVTERVGLEVDLKLGTPLTQGLHLLVGQGLFLPDTGVSTTDASPTGVASWSFAQLTGSL